MGDVGSVAMCRRIFKHQTSESGEIPFFKIGTFGGTPDAYISRELFDEFKTKYPYPEKGDILISASGSIGRTVEFTGKDEYFQDSNIVWLKHNKSIINPFLRHLYEVVEWAGIEGSTIKRLYNDNILKTEVSIPTVPEQAKIAGVLDDLDNLITLHQREYTAYSFEASLGESTVFAVFSSALDLVKMLFFNGKRLDDEDPVQTLPEPYIIHFTGS